MANLCTRNDVLRIAYGRTDAIDVSGSNIDSAIEDADQEVYGRYGDSVKIQFCILTARTQYEFRKNNVETHSIRNFFINSPNISVNNSINRNALVSGSYTVDLITNKITLTTSQATNWNGSYGQVDYIPQKWHLLAKNKAALNILDADVAAMNPGEGGTENPRVSRIAKRISRLEADLNPGVAVGSFEKREYDSREDREIITQRRFNQTA